MARRKAIVKLAILGVAILSVAAFISLPKKYRIGEKLYATKVFWDSRQAFLLVRLQTLGLATNAAQEQFGDSFAAYAIPLLFTGDGIRMQERVVAYHLLESGSVQKIELPKGSGFAGRWTVHGGALQFTPSKKHRPEYGDSGLALRWDGKKFRSLRANASAPALQTEVDEADEVSGTAGAEVAESTPQNGGRWYRNTLVRPRKEAGKSEWPIKVGKSTFVLSQRNLPRRDNTAPFDVLSLLGWGPENLVLSGGSLTASATLWQQQGWREVSKKEFELLPNQPMKYNGIPAGVWLLVVGGVLLWKFWRLLRFLYGAATAKTQTLSRMSSDFSLPPVSPSQFASIDIEKLDRCTAELEALGFRCQLDYSLVDDAQAMPNFCRLMISTSHQCYSVIYQFFPAGERPRPMKCDIQCELDDGWDIEACESKPRAEAYALHSPRKISVYMPGVSMHELLQRFLSLRAQVCADLSIAPEREVSQDGWIRGRQREIEKLRAGFKRKVYPVTLLQTFVAMLQLLRTKREYLLEGDYPKEAERRRNGYVVAEIR